MRAPIPALALAALMSAGPLHAQEAAPAAACGAVDAALPPAFAGWTAKSPVVSASAPGALAGAALTVGSGAAAMLHPTPEVRYAVLPEKPGGSVSQGGMFSLNIGQPGTYAVALGSGAWIDLIRDGATVASTAHGHGPACSSIRKVVDFDLKRGRYIVQVSANADPELRIMVARRP